MINLTLKGTSPRFVLVGVLTIVALLGIGTALSGCEANHELVTQEAVEFARGTLGMKAPIVSCQDHDTNGDGYITCTVVDKGTTDRESIKCATYGSWNSTCSLKAD